MKNVSLSLFVIQSNELLNRNCSPPETLALARSRQKQRIVRPLVLDTLFRASSFRNSGCHTCVVFVSCVFACLNFEKNIQRIDRKPEVFQHQDFFIARGVLRGKTRNERL